MDKNKVTGVLYEKWMIILLIVLVVLFSNLSPVFLSMGNASNFFRSVPGIAIVTLGITIVIISGGTDLSSGSIVAISGTLAAYLAAKGYNPVIVILIGILVGALCGYLNGFLITQFKLAPFIVTIGTSYFLRGLVNFQTNGIFIKGLPDWFYNLSNIKVYSIIYSNTLIFIVIAIVVAYIMKNTRFGRYSYMVGANAEAARLSGINVSKHIRKVYIFSGVLSAVAGILMMSYLNVGAPSEGAGMEVFAIAGAIIGGCQFSGGVGKVGGSIAGIFTIEVFKNGLAVIGINSFGQQAVTGLIIIVAVIVDYYRKSYMFKSKSVGLEKPIGKSSKEKASNKIA